MLKDSSRSKTWSRVSGSRVTRSTILVGPGWITGQRVIHLTRFSSFIHSFIIIIIIIRKFITRTCSQALSMNRRRNVMHTYRSTACRKGRILRRQPTNDIMMKFICQSGSAIHYAFVNIVDSFMCCEWQGI